jgi:hypothetical protein
LGGGQGVVGVLLADALDLDQLGVAVGLQLGGGLAGPGVGQLGLGLGVGGAIGRGVDLVEDLALLDDLALGEGTRQDDPVDLGPDL